jgi:glycerophosphoryl diester phosphodiesterase
MKAPPAVGCISDHPADRNLLDLLLAMKAFSWHPNFTRLTRDQVGRMHASGLKVFPWTITTAEEAQKTLAMEVDGLICNELRIMQSVRSTDTVAAKI